MCAADEMPVAAAMGWVAAAEEVPVWGASRFAARGGPPGLPRSALVGPSLRDLRRLDWREAVLAVRQGSSSNDLPSYASAIAFRALLGLLPFLLFLMALLGVLNLGELYRLQLAPALQASTSPEVFVLVDATAIQVLTVRQPFWLTAGAALAIWVVSSAVRAVMKALNGVYETTEERPVRKQILVSLWLAVAVGGCLVLAGIVVRFGPLMFPPEVSGTLGAVLALIVSWAVAAGLLLLAVGLLVRQAPATSQRLEWVGFGSLLTVAFWVVASIGFALYLNYIADYASVFGGLATVFLLMIYLQLSAAAFLLGAQADAVIRRRLEGSESGE
ncbi:MAG: YihY family inner membrane protein [Actinomycetota bacterium]|nr:YihY family inner membrane protein [Actinomycetota bacterium]